MIPLLPRDFPPRREPYPRRHAGQPMKFPRYYYILASIIMLLTLIEW